MPDVSTSPRRSRRPQPQVAAVRSCAAGAQLRPVAFASIAAVFVLFMAASSAVAALRHLPARVELLGDHADHRFRGVRRRNDRGTPGARRAVRSHRPPTGPGIGHRPRSVGDGTVHRRRRRLDPSDGPLRPGHRHRRGHDHARRDPRRSQPAPRAAPRRRHHRCSPRSGWASVHWAVVSSRSTGRTRPDWSTCCCSRLWSSPVCSSPSYPRRHSAGPASYGRSSRASASLRGCART